MIPDLDRLALVHGDFRLGNLLVGPDRLRAVLDWEGAHLGDPHEDLGYIAITSWRFGEIGHPVGGFGTREALAEAYEAAGGLKIDPARVRFWELAFTMNWGIQCAQMAEQFLTGADPSVERGAIGRRRSETELDLLQLLDRSVYRA
jgi:aminoglycoside phosphotransferase (APT) family kinase protein